MAFHVVVAHDLNRGIGINGQLPWHCPADMAYFKALTIGDGASAVIMGRQTWASIPSRFRPLPHRFNIVLTTHSNFNVVSGVRVAHSLNEALDAAKSASAIYVIGGQSVYEQALNHPDCGGLYVTKIFKAFECDVYFPSYRDQYQCVYASNIWVHSGGNCGFFQYTRRAT